MNAGFLFTMQHLVVELVSLFCIHHAVMSYFCLVLRFQLPKLTSAFPRLFCFVLFCLFLSSLLCTFPSPICESVRPSSSNLSFYPTFSTNLTSWKKKLLMLLHSVLVESIQLSSFEHMFVSLFLTKDYRRPLAAGAD